MKKLNLDILKDIFSHLKTRSFLFIWVTDLFFIVETIFLRIMGKQGGVISPFYQFAQITRYLYLFLFFIFVFKLFLVLKKELSSSQEKITKIVYISAQALLLFIFCLIFVKKYSFPTQTIICRCSYFSFTILLISAIFAFILRRWFTLKSSKEEQRLLIDLFSFYEILALISSFIVLMKLLFSLKTLFLLSWLYWLFAVYFFVAIIYALAVTCLKKEVLQNFNYPLIYNFFKKGDGSFLDVVEENTGLSFKSMWSLKYSLTLVPAIVLSILILLVLATTVYKVDSYQQAALYRFGVLQPKIVQTGLHLKYPWPIDQIEIFDVKRSRSRQIGYTSSDAHDFLWTQKHDGGEYTLLLGNGNELVSINLKLIYDINDLYSFLTVHAQPEKLLAAKTYEILMEHTVATDLNNFLSVDRTALTFSLKDELQKYSQEQRLGLNVKDVIMESIHPPVEVADVYQSVVSAKIRKNTLLSNAKLAAYKNMTNAEQQRQVLIINAKSNQIKKLSQARYEMAVYNAAFKAYRINPYSYRLTKYLATYEKVILGSKIYVFSPNLNRDFSRYIINFSQLNSLNKSNSATMLNLPFDQKE